MRAMAAVAASGKGRARTPRRLRRVKQLLDEVQADKPRPTRDQYRHDFLLRIGRPFHLGAAACVDQSTLMSATLAMVCHFCVSAAMKSRLSWSVSTRGCTASSARRAA